ncbi:MAG TPA: glycosyltransferase family 4 protein [Croceibacterium sp.]
MSSGSAAVRILSVSNFYDTHGGGLERVAGHLAREFALLGHHSAWAASDADGLPASPARLVALRCANPTERLTGLPMPLPGTRSITSLARAVREADVVVIHDALYVTSILAMLLAKARRKSVVLVQHISSIQFASRLLRGVMRLANALVTRPMIAAADDLVFISQTVRTDLLGPEPRRPSALLFNGVDQAVFNARERCPAAQTRLRWGLPAEARVAIFVGRFVEKKGLRILRELAAQRPDIHFALVGKGPIDPAEWRLGNVHVLGQQPQDVVADLYRCASLLILPSVGEGYPLVIQEAMACGLPVVCGKPADQADPDARCWLRGIPVDLADPPASAARCSAAIDTLTLSESDRASMARYAAERYDWRKMAEGILTLSHAPNSARA